MALPALPPLPHMNTWRPFASNRAVLPPVGSTADQSAVCSAMLQAARIVANTQYGVRASAHSFDDLFLHPFQIVELLIVF